MRNFQDEIVGGDNIRRYKLIDENGNVIYSGLKIEKDYIPDQEGTTFGASDVKELQDGIQTGWSKVDEALTVAGNDPVTQTFFFSAPSSITSVLQFGTKVKFTQDGTVKYATVKSITVSGETATIYFDSDVEITVNTITDFYCNNSLPMGFPSELNRDTIIESGSNANGYYVKYSDGTMECYKVLTVTTNASGAASVTFPLAFLTGTEPVVNCDVYATQSITSTKTLQSTTPTGFTIGICTGGVVSASKSHKIAYRAIGRWK